MKNKILLVAFTLLTLFFSFCNFSNSKNYDVEATRKNYDKYCASCHGPQLQKFKNKNWQQESTLAETITIIKEGLPQDGMSGYAETFSPKEIKNLANFILEYDHKSSASTPRVESTEDFDIEIVVDGLEIPWGMEFLPNGDMLITEKKGVLSRFTKDKKLIPIAGLPPIRDKGQGGLMDIKLHPNFEDNNWLYISYSYVDEADDDASNTAIIRAKIVEDKLEDIQEIYKGIPALRSNHHFGNRMVFDKEGYLYFSNGDRGKRDIYPQKLDNSNGKIHRLHDDGSVPDDNPFVNQTNAVHSIYSYGHRNPQGLALHPETGKVWEHEHGPKGGDEINIIKKGENYGWPVISYGINYIGTKFTDITEKEGMLQPVHYYVPSIAPCGMTFVDSPRYPAWKNNILIGSLSFRYLERVVLEGDKVIKQEKLLEDLGSRVRDVRMGRDGFIYVSLEDPGRIIRLVPRD